MMELADNLGYNYVIDLFPTGSYRYRFIELYSQDYKEQAYVWQYWLPYD
jgi:hypothetical protein